MLLPDPLTRAPAPAPAAGATGAAATATGTASSTPGATGAAPLDGGGLLVAMGLLLLAGFVAQVVGRRAHVPRVTLLLLIGIVAGPEVLGIAPASLVQWFPLVAEVALAMIGFALGEQFLGSRLRRTGRVVGVVALLVTVSTTAFVLLGLLLVGMPAPMAILLAAIAAATDPASVVDVVRDVRSEGPLTDTVLGVVALDDAIGVILFSLLMVAARTVSGDAATADALLHGLREAGGGVLLGLVFGLPMAMATGRVRSGRLTMLEALGFVLCGAGTASLLEVSPIITAMTMGAVVANLAWHHTRPFHEIEHVTEPFLVMFFLLAGFRLDFAALAAGGGGAVAYLLARTAGRAVGGWTGGRLARAPAAVRRGVGWCLLPQAGVALGLGLHAAEAFPEHGDRLLSLLVGTTAVFEILGPVAARLCLDRGGEVGRGRTEDTADDADEADEADEAAATGIDAQLPPGSPGSPGPAR